ncbi:calcium-binding protein, partial [Sphingomonas parva]
AFDQAGGTFIYSPAANYHGTDAFTILVSDGQGGTTEKAIAVTITPVNDAPALGTPTAGRVTFTEGDVSVALMGGVTLSDPDAPTNFAGGSIGLNVSGGPGGLNLRAGSPFAIVPQGGGRFDIVYQDGPTQIGFGTISGFGTPNVSITALTAFATNARVNELLDDFVYVITGENPAAGDRLVTLTFDDGGNTGGGGLAATVTQTLAVVAVNDAPRNFVPANLAGTEDKDLVLTGANRIVVADADAATLSVTLGVGHGTLRIANLAGINVVAGANGSATMTIQGTAAAINAALDGLVYRGALNYEGADTLTVTTSDGGETGTGGVLTDTDTVAITLADDGRINGGSGPDDVTGGDGAELFMLDDGGDDEVFGGGGNDGFYFGGAYTPADAIDGGIGRDQVALQGDYNLELGPLTGIEDLILLSGSDTRFGNAGTDSYDYLLTSRDSNVAAGQTMLIDAVMLMPGESVTFDGSAETDGSFIMSGGRGSDTFIGGSGADGFYFRSGAYWNPGDKVIGDASDQIGFRGDFTGPNRVVMGADQISGVNTIVLMSGVDIRFGPIVPPTSFDITMHDGNAAAGQRFTIDGFALAANETARIDGSAELDAWFRLIGGAGNDQLIGGALGDTINAGGGADQLTGGGGNDVFIYRGIADSVTGAHDTITDFRQGDIIDLSRIDAISGGVDDAFNFIGSGAFSGQAGQLRAVGSGNAWVVQADVDGDSNADFELHLISADSHLIATSDFVL